MCGIIGITGKTAAAPLLAALERLEYRGYDSAGIATIVNGKIERRRAEGKLKNLAELLQKEPWLLEDPAAYEGMARAHNPFGDGLASGRIVETSRRFLEAGDPLA